MIHPSTFEYLTPTKNQLKAMEAMRSHAHDYAIAVDKYVYDGPDKTYIMRKLRELAMWVNTAITRYEDGMPRE